MKILSAEQIRQADAHTITNEPVSSINLMERAATAACNWIQQQYPEQRSFKIFCGIGNNGGDGLAIARLLHQADCEVKVYAVRFSQKSSEDFQANENRLKEIGLALIEITDEQGFPEIKKTDLVIDALFGSGLSRPVSGFAAELIKRINSSKAEVVAIDVPSGLFCENNADNDRKAIIEANHTLSFQVPKLAFMFPENESNVGEWHIINIGLDEEFIEGLPGMGYYVTRNILAGLVKKRKKFSHKGTYGHALLIVGSKGKMGAGVLSAIACLRSGAGLVTAHVPQCGNQVFQVAAPEVMLRLDDHDEYLTGCAELSEFSSVGVGPGIGTGQATQQALKLLIQEAGSPVVFDADAINILGKNKTWVTLVSPGSIFTPHPKEFERLVGESDGHYERLQMQKNYSLKFGVYIILKGSNTAITCPDGEVYFNSTGNPGMATAGSGDVLTGIITGLLAQGYDSKQASVLGVYLHGFVGDVVADEIGQEAMIAGDLVKGISSGYKSLITDD